MVYDGWHATPEDHAKHRGLATANRASRRVVCVERAELRSLSNLDDDITLHRSACLWKLWFGGRARKSAARIPFYRFRRLESYRPRHCKLWGTSGSCIGVDQ